MQEPQLLAAVGFMPIRTRIDKPINAIPGSGKEAPQTAAGGGAGGLPPVSVRGAQGPAGARGPGTLSPLCSVRLCYSCHSARASDGPEEGVTSLADGSFHSWAEEMPKCINREGATSHLCSRRPDNRPLSQCFCASSLAVA